MGTAGGASQQPGEKEGKAVRKQREADTVRRIDLIEITLESNDADEVQRCPAPLENHVTGAAVALGPEDDVVRSWQAAHPAYCLRSLRGKRLGRDLNQVNAFHGYVLGHGPFIVVEEVVDLRHAWRARIALDEVGHVVQRHDLRIEGRVIAELNKVLAESQTTSVVVVVALILVLVLGAGAHDGSFEDGKVRGR